MLTKLRCCLLARTTISKSDIVANLSYLHLHRSVCSMHGRSFSICKILDAKVNDSGNLKQQRNLHSHNYDSRNEWKARSILYKTMFIIGTSLAGGIIIKTGMKSVNADDDDNGDNDTVESEIDNIHISEYYAGNEITLTEAVKRSKAILERKKIQNGCPGISVAVSVDGNMIWADGFGYSDLENMIPITPETILRIASISKPIAMVTVAKEVEAGRLDLDAPIQQYVPEFPEKTWKNEKVTITTRQLLCHLSGIRDYNKDYIQKAKKNGTEDSKKKNTLPDEYHIMKKYDSVKEGLDLFKDDPLVHAPGSKFLYTTHGWTLVSAVVEKVTTEHKDFLTYYKSTLQELGMRDTYPDHHSPLIPNRGRHYVKNERGRVVNAPYVDLSYKWAGGGLISNVLDVIKFGNAMLYSYQADISRQDKKNLCNEVKQGYLKPETMKLIWSPIKNAEVKWEGIANGHYGLGWKVQSVEKPIPFCQEQKFYACHTGGAVGASSVVLILPNTRSTKGLDRSKIQSDSVRPLPQGVVVAIIANISECGFEKDAYDIATLFERVKF
ncbi:hypothetical protein ACF0H5_009171 [Mactra antiquata]